MSFGRQTVALDVVAFRNAFARCLSNISHAVSTESDNRALCEEFEKIAQFQKRGFWGRVGYVINADSVQCERYYTKQFQTAAYSDALSGDDKAFLEEQTVTLYQNGAGKRQIADRCKELMKNRDICPSRIESLVFHTLQKNSQRQQKQQLKPVQYSTCFETMVTGTMSDVEMKSQQLQQKCCSVLFNDESEIDFMQCNLACPVEFVLDPFE
uniref:Uncharacterized protein n=1 Tax=Trepomonas sp. PC1 TaxID=1076344 RepID=A0A146K4K6_9EUKA|eukprot:JAP91822.1 Hypothetical protein TPC1_16439 [Trepomonas sp. PC1]